MTTLDQPGALATAPLVSVVIPGYNCAKHIVATLESVLAQNYPRFEVVFIDDGCTDNTHEVVAPFLGRIVYHRQENGGLAAARNAGLRIARGEFIAWGDADDLFIADRLLVQSAYLASNPRVAAVGSNFAAFDDDVGIFDSAHAARYYSQVRDVGLDRLFPQKIEFAGKGVEWLSAPFAKNYQVYWGDVWRKIVLGNFMHPPTLMLRRDARESAGWLRTGIGASTDWEFTSRLAKVGALAFIDEAFLKYRYHSEQMTSPLRDSKPAFNDITVIESAMRDQAVQADRQLLGELEHVLAELHSDAAYALAEVAPLEALRHLREAWRSPRCRKGMARSIARIAMPRVGFRLLRSLRGLEPSGAHRRMPPVP